MESANRNFSIVEGDSFSASVTLVDKTTGNPINLTGTTCKMQVRTSYNSPDPPALEFTAGNGITVDGPNGKMTFLKTVNLLAGEYVYDLQVVFGGPITTTFLRGRFVVLEGVTV